MQTAYDLPQLSGTVLWLIPSAKGASAFRKEIVRLSDHFNTVQFLPHLTLGRLPDSSTKDDIYSPKKSIRFNQSDAICADFDALRCTDNPYQNLVASLEPSPELDRLQSEIEMLTPGYIRKSEYHVSLMYGYVPCDKIMDQLTDLTERLPQEVCFSKLSAVKLKGGPESWQSVWEING